MLKNKEWYLKGLKDGIPIALGYFAVAFTLGIAAKNAGLTAFQAFITSALTNASAGGYAGFTLIGAGAAYIELAVTELIVNARYLLMSCALSQKIAPETPLIHRMLMAFDVTDEIFGISVSVTGTLNPFYNYGAIKRRSFRYVFGDYNSACKKKQADSNACFNINGGKPCLFKNKTVFPAFGRYENNYFNRNNIINGSDTLSCKG